MSGSGLRKAAVSTLRAAGVPAALRRLNRSRPAILIYHGFSERPSLESVNGHLHMHRDVFERQLRFFREHHRVAPLRDVVALAAEGRPAPGNALALTSDDGYGSVYQIAFPLLEKYDASMTVFLASDFVDGSDHLWHDRVAYCVDSRGQQRSAPIEMPIGDETLLLDFSSPASRAHGTRAMFDRIKLMGPAERAPVLAELEARSGFRLGDSGPVPPEFAHLTWPQVREMIASGRVSFGSHTKTHSILTRCSEAEVEHELTTSKRRIEEETGEACDAFCYPNGTPADVSDEIGRTIERCGYGSAFTGSPGLVSRASDPFALPRFSANRPLETLEFRIAGLG